MAIFHLSVKPICRSAGRSSTAAAAYRSGCKIVDRRTGEIHDYRIRKGVVSTHILLPSSANQWALDRSHLWNEAESIEKRKDACVAREIVVALPAELSSAERRNLVIEFGQQIAEREGCAVDIGIHQPNIKGDQRNQHAHILKTTRKVEAAGLGDKLDTEKAGRNRVRDLSLLRELWEKMTNHYLQKNGVKDRVDHRSLKAQGIERAPTKHKGPGIRRIKNRPGTKDQSSAFSIQARDENHKLIEALKEEISREENALNPLSKKPSLLKKALEINQTAAVTTVQQFLSKPLRKVSRNDYSPKL